MTCFEKPVVATVSDKLGRFGSFHRFTAVLRRLSDYILLHFCSSALQTLNSASH